MPSLNADVPTFECLLRREFLHDLDPQHEGEYDRCTVFGLSSLAGRALGFWALVQETGAVIGRLPVSAFCTEPCPREPLDQLQLWDCFAYDVSVWEPGFLEGRRCLTVLKDGREIEATAMFVVDWYGNADAENAGEIGWKCAHLLELETGNLALQPNNRILWYDPATQDPSWQPDRPEYRIMTHTWSVEGRSRWGTSDRHYYDVRRVGDPPEGEPQGD